MCSLIHSDWHKKSSSFECCCFRHSYTYLLKKTICVKECETGFYGPNCTMQCPQGTYGIDCQHKCSCGIKDCHHVFGCFKGNVTTFLDSIPIENSIKYFLLFLHYLK